MEIFVLLLLFLLNGAFALSEIALVSSKKARLEQEKKDGNSGAKYALKLLKDPDKFLAAIQVGITLIGIVTGAYGGTNIADDVTPLFVKIPFTAKYAGEIAMILTVGVITFVSIVIGELVPKTIALSNPSKIAMKVAPSIYYFSKFFSVFVKSLSASTHFIDKIIGVKRQSDQITEAELKQMLKTATDEGVIEEEQNDMHENIFYFSDKKAKHIMTPRVDVEWIDLNAPRDKFIADLSSVTHSVIICSKEVIDNIEGLLYVKDFYKYGLHAPENFNVADYIIEPTFVHKNCDAQKVLDIFKHKRIHTCCVVDEYGGFEGIITKYDILESIVGQIPDTNDPEPGIFVRDDGSTLISGDMPIESLVDVIDGFPIDFDELGYSTVAGFVLKHIDKLPMIGDKFQFMGYTIEIVDIDGKKIDKILISG